MWSFNLFSNVILVLKCHGRGHVHVRARIPIPAERDFHERSQLERAAVEPQCRAADALVVGKRELCEEHRGRGEQVRRRGGAQPPRVPAVAVRPR